MLTTGSARFFTTLDGLARTSSVVIDRPKKKPHPRVPDAIYPVDYGHLQGTTGGDGDGIDVFVGAATGAGVVAVLLTADIAKRDCEIKLLPDCSPDEVEQVHRFIAEVLQIGGHLVARGDGERPPPSGAAPMMLSSAARSAEHSGKIVSTEAHRVGHTGQRRRATARQPRRDSLRRPRCPPRNSGITR